MSKSNSKWYSFAAGAMLLTAGGLFLRSKKTISRRLSGKVVLVNGGSRGLGLQLAREFVKENCKLILVARSEEELETAGRELRTASADVETIACDLTRPGEIASMLRGAQAIHGRIDVVINDAGRIDVASVDSLNEENFHAAMDLMFWAPVRIVLGLLPSLLKSGDADIVNICSIGGKIAVAHLLPYSSAKFALCGFSEGLDAELRTRGVHVLTVIPGLLRTGAHKQATFAGNREAEYSWFSLGATIPGASMEVGRAARQIVSALKARRRTLTLTWSAQLAMRLHGAFPTFSMLLMSQVNRLLPAPKPDQTKERGGELEKRQPALLRAITGLGESAAKTQNENL